MIQPFAEDLAALQPPQWSRLEGAGVVARASLLAYGRAMGEGAAVASVWDRSGQELRALSLVTVFERASERWMLLSRGLGVPQSVLFAGLEADAAAARELLAEVIDHARGLRVKTLVLGHTSSALGGILRAAAELGFRLLPRPAWQLDLAPGTTFPQYFGGLRRAGRQCLRRDLRRLSEAGLEMQECQPTAAVLDEAWPLCLALFRRRGIVAPRENLLAALVRQVPAGLLLFAPCRRAGALRGLTIGTREGTRAVIEFLLHVDDPGVNVYSGMSAWWLKQEIERGSQSLFYSLYNDHYKQRLGCRPLPHQYGFLRLR